MNYSLLIEAVLYLKGKALSIDEIAEIVGCEKETIESGLIDLMSIYASRESALEIVENKEGFALRLKKEFENLVQKILPVDLGKGALRTLAAIALKTPISQAELVDLRGSSAYQQIQELLEQGFIRRRKQSDGRSYWLSVTEKFHQYFEIDDLSKLIGKSSLPE